MSETKNNWTLMVYLAGNNNLGEECVFALTEMKKVGLNSRLLLFVGLYSARRIIIKKRGVA
jgi:hypothetical protein